MAPPPTPRHAGSGIALGLLSAASFGVSGSIARSLLDEGWSPGAAVTARIALAALILLPAGLRAMRGFWHLVRPNARTIVLFGLLAVAGCQLFYFNAVQTLSVGVALLLEYLGIVLVVAWQWVRHHRRPQRGTILGVVLAVAGLVLVLDVFGGMEADAVGVLWGLAAAVGLAVYFVVAGEDRTGLPPIAMATAGMLVGASVLALAGLAGALPVSTASADVDLAGVALPWWAAVLGLGLVAGALAYGTGVVSARVLGSKVAAFLGLTEVLFAVLFAWLLLDQLPTPVQLAGGVLIIAGVAVVRREELAAVPAVGAEPLPEPEPELGSEPQAEPA